MSDFYNLSIIIPVHTKNTVYLCKQATGQIDGAMIAFPGCKFVSRHLFGEFPGEPEGKTALNQAGFFSRASLRFLPPRDCKGGGCVPWRQARIFWLPHLWPSWGRPGHCFCPCWWWSLLFPCLLLPRRLMPGVLFLTLASAVWAPPSLLRTWCQMRSTSWACLGPPVLGASGVEEESGWPL